MSNQSTVFLKNVAKSNVGFTNILIRNFSRRNVKSGDSYKVIKPRKAQKDDTRLAWRDPNFELLASPDFPFFMRGNVGPAWYDVHTTINSGDTFIMQEIQNDPDEGIVCRAQECPKVFRQTVCDLFPYHNLENSELSVITITLKPDKKRYRHNKELETEKLAQLFVLAAKNVCHKLRKAGYWADFVNPFSGRPYFSSSGHILYQTDQKFRCLDFQIYEIDKCVIISNDQDCPKNTFKVGSVASEISSITSTFLFFIFIRSLLITIVF